LSADSELIQVVRTAPERAIGRIFLDKYVLSNLLGSGGWSAVYKATLLTEPSRWVAVKIPHAVLLEQQDIARFRREARALSSLRHRNSVELLDYGLCDGRPYLVLELAPGTTLEEVQACQTLTIDAVLAIYEQLCDVLGEAHQIGFIHRDLKPPNVIVKDIRDLHVKLIDFGATKSVSENASVITNTGETIGTPAYMSPEQCLAQPLDSRSDIYSLGCMLYESLTRRRPFSGKNPMATMQQQVMIEAPPFTEAELLEIPPRLEAIVLKCLKKDPDKRFESMHQLRNQLTKGSPSGNNVVARAQSFFSGLQGKFSKPRK
jgi:serine/threonine protein kinase